MVYVFFKGLGRWLNTEVDELCDMGVDEVTYFYDACGIFQLNKDSEIEYKYTKELPNLQILLPCKHEDDELKRAIKIKGIIRDDFNLPRFIKTEEQKKYFYFEIAPYNKNILRVIDLDVDNPAQEIKETYGNQNQFISSELKILNEASKKWWGNADPEEKGTHTKQEIVEQWLINNGFSKNKAETGASIIRPEWAAKGNY